MVYRILRGNIIPKLIILLFHVSLPRHYNQKKSAIKKGIITVAHKQEAGMAVVCLTDADLPPSEERMHVVDICHELAVTKGEVSHISARLSSCQHLEQSWRKRTCVKLQRCVSIQ